MQTQDLNAVLVSAISHLNHEYHHLKDQNYHGAVKLSFVLINWSSVVENAVVPQIDLKIVLELCLDYSELKPNF